MREGSGGEFEEARELLVACPKKHLCLLLRCIDDAQLLESVLFADMLSHRNIGRVVRMSVVDMQLDTMNKSVLVW